MTLVLEHNSKISLGSRKRITLEGVDGSGPLYERVAVIADDWLKEHGLA